MLAKEATEKRIDPRVKRTRDLLVRAFNELVEEKGHSGLTVQEIAERATINRATFYAHFRDQYELFDYVISEAFREEIRRRLPVSPGFSEENLRVIILAVCDYLEGLNTACSWSDRRFRPLIEARVQGELYELLLGWIEVLQHKTNGKPTPPEVVASVVSWAIFGAGLQWSRNESPRSAEEIADQIFSVIVGGLDGSVSPPTRIS
ncbi:MAG: TetR/AcrR family transcriptional regulator [Actinomycetota bacterium]|nr:TetR/AcrR family transcriptional regulator [Actinomycetota bacterium]